MLKKWIKPRFAELHLSNQIFIALMAILTISVLSIGFTAYVIFSATFSSQILQTQKRTLQQSERTTIAIIRNIEQTTVSKSIDSTFLYEIEANSLKASPDLDNLVYQLRELRNSNRYTFSVYLYLLGEKRVITSNDGTWNIDSFYEANWMSSLTSDRNSVWIQPRTNTDNTGMTSQILSYVVRLQGQNNDPEEYLIVNIDVKELAKSIENAQPIPGEQTMITSQDGVILVSSMDSWIGKSFQEYIDSLSPAQKNDYQTIVQSGYNNWYFINRIPAEYVKAPVVRSAVQTTLITSLWILLGILFARILTRGIAKPYHTIVSRLKEFGNTKNAVNEADFLRDAIGEIIEQNQFMTDQISLNETTERSNLVRSLLLQNQSVSDSVNVALQQANNYLRYPQYYLVLAGLDHAARMNREMPSQNQNLWRFCVLNILEERMLELGDLLHTQIDRDHYAFILSSQAEAVLVIEKAQQSYEDIQKYLPLTVTLAVSQPFSQLIDMTTAYDECMELLQHRLELGSRVITETVVRRGNMDDIAHLTGLLKRDQLDNYLRQGNLSEIGLLVDRLERTFKTHPNPVPDTIYMMMSTILNDAISLIIENGWALENIFPKNQNLYQELMEQETLEDMGLWMKQILQQMAPSFIEKKESRNESIIESIMTYLNDHYHEDIRLNTLADSVYLSPSYLSRLFKQETGTNFIETLTMIRIKQSKKMLADSSLKISDIADRCSLGSSNNYIRLFRKYEGMTPGQYRNGLARHHISQVGEDSDHE